MGGRDEGPHLSVLNLRRAALSSATEGVVSVGRWRAILQAVLEQQRQDAKWGEQNHDPEVWLAILTEEIGELSQEILRRRFAPEEVRQNLQTELVQVTAVALSMLECCNRKGWHK